MNVGEGQGRLPLVDNDSSDPALAKVFDTFRNAGREVPNLYRTLGNSPAMLNAWVGHGLAASHTIRSRHAPCAS